MWWADNSEIDKNLPISNSKLDLGNVNAHIMFGEKPLICTPISCLETKIQIIMLQDIKTHFFFNSAWTGLLRTWKLKH